MSDELALIADDLSVLRMVRNDDDDDPDARFEKLMDKLKMLQNLIQKAKAAGKNVSASVPDEITELKQAVMETTVVVDEAAQMFTNKETSLCKAQLKFAAPADEEHAKAQEELYRSAFEAVQLADQRFEQITQLQKISEKMDPILERIQQLTVHNATLCSGKNDKTVTGASRISSLEAQLEKIRGKHDFTRYLVQLLLMAGKGNIISNAKLSQLFELCGELPDSN